MTCLSKRSIKDYSVHCSRSINPTRKFLSDNNNQCQLPVEMKSYLSLHSEIHRSVQWNCNLEHFAQVFHSRPSTKSLSFFLRTISGIRWQIGCGRSSFDVIVQCPRCFQCFIDRFGWMINTFAGCHTLFVPLENIIRVTIAQIIFIVHWNGRERVRKRRKWCDRCRCCCCCCCQANVSSLVLLTWRQLQSCQWKHSLLILHWFVGGLSWRRVLSSPLWM